MEEPPAEKLYLQKNFIKTFRKISLNFFKISLEI